MSNKQKIYVTSDWHFSHKNIIVNLSNWTSSKPFRHFDSIHHMNSTIINNINEVVGQKDILWCLGDIVFGKIEELPKLMDRIICNNINLIYGNHDKSIKKSSKYKSLFNSVQDYKSIYYNDVKVCLFHYPIISWNGMNKGSIQLYGHCHGNLHDTGARQMDVGIDTNNYYPYLLDDVITQLSKRPIKVSGDHHK